MLGNLPINVRGCLIHATHLTAGERQCIATAGAVATLCRVTEANLGAGLFPAKAFLSDGGRIAIGTDSNVRIDAAEELRMLEYGQRLFHRERNVLAAAGGSTGMRLFGAALMGGAQALDATPRRIIAGGDADLMALRVEVGLHNPDDAFPDRWLLGRDVTVADVWAAGVCGSGRRLQPA